MGNILGHFVQPSFPAFFTVFLFINILICIIYIVFRNNSYLHNMGVYLFPFFLGTLGLRLIIPLELRYSKTYYFTGLYDEFMMILYSPRFSIWGKDISLLFILTLIIIIGMAVNLLRFIKEYQIFCDVLLINSKLCSKRDNAILNNVLGLYEKKAHIELIRSDLIATPIIFGLIRPCIAIPDQDYNDTELEYMLSHEVAHYYRKDLWTKLIVQLICIFYWWNPLIYLLKDDISKFLELRTDLAVIKGFTQEEKSYYSDCIFSIYKSQNSNKLKPLGNIVAFGNDSTYLAKQRMSMVLDSYKPSFFKKIIVVIPMVLLISASYLVVFDSTDIFVSTEDLFQIDRSTSYIIATPDGKYELYVFDKYSDTIDDLLYNFNQVEDVFGRIHNSMLKLKIYKSYEEAIKDEKRFD